MGIELLDLYKRHVKKEWKTAFLSALLLGLFIHLFKFTNTLPNHDSVYNYYATQNGIQSGRWLLFAACGLSSFFDLTWITGILSLLYIAVAAVIVVDTLEIRNPVLILLTSGILLSFPGITETFFFQFTADGYFLAMALAALSVRLTKFDCLSIRNTLLAAIFICCTCAIYQTYVSFALVLAMGYFLVVAMDPEITEKQIAKWIGVQAFVYIAGLLAYFIAWKVLMYIGHYQANDYQGISTLAFSFKTILNAFPTSFMVLKKLFFQWTRTEYGVSLYGHLNQFFLGATIFILIYSIIKTKVYQKKTKLFLVLLCAVCIPFAVCLWLFASELLDYRPMMLVSVCPLYITGAVLFEKYGTKIPKNLLGLLLAAIIFNNCIMTNIAYYFMNRSYFSTYAMASEMISEIHDLDTDTRDIAFIGDMHSDVLLVNQKLGRKIETFSYLLETTLLFDDIHAVNFINETFYQNYKLVDPQWLEYPETASQISSMPCWPNNNSVQLIDDVIVVKLSEEPAF